MNSSPNPVDFIGFLITVAVMVYLFFKMMLQEKQRRHPFLEEEEEDFPVKSASFKRVRIPSVKPDSKREKPKSAKPIPNRPIASPIRAAKKKTLSAKQMILYKTIIDPPKALHDNPFRFL